MHERAFRRAVALGVGILLLATTTALADTVQPSTDGVAPLSGGTIDLGNVAAGAKITVDLSFIVSCSGPTQVAPGTSLSLADFGSNVQGGGSLVSISNAVVGPAPLTWSSCATGDSFGGGSPSEVVLTAPTSPGSASYLLLYSVSPPGVAGSYAGATIDLTVPGDQPPVLDLPGPIAVEGNTLGGAKVTYTATATDAEDPQAPAVRCLPASGSLFPLGTTTVSCSATDSASQTTTGSFDVTVVDTTPPTLQDVPGPISLTTYDSGGAVVTYQPPTATDIVDASPSVACGSPSGSVFPVGTSTVTCTATDSSDNHSTATFSVDVTQVHLGATFEAPIGPTDTLGINPGRTLPVKATVTADGMPVTTGSVTLSLAACDGTTLRPPAPLAFVEGRWFLGLDTTGLSGCTLGTLLLDGHAAGSFQMLGPGSTSASPRHRR